MSQHPLRQGYPLPPNGGKLGPRPVTYSSQTFSSQLHHHYNFNPPPNQTGFSFQNSMLLPQSTHLPLPIASSSMESPVSYYNIDLPAQNAMYFFLHTCRFTTPVR